jgi:hypothetical protein
VLQETQTQEDDQTSRCRSSHCGHGARESVLREGMWKSTTESTKGSRNGARVEMGG